ncbi:MAG: RMD1 family protein [Clostridia bacterium]|nr:RMD1 family protein [Clostridia bacterium]
MEQKYQDLKFKAYSIAKEIDLNKIAEQCNLRKKYTWEEPLILNEPELSGIIGYDAVEGRQVMVFSFGCVVFVNTTNSEVQKFFDYLISLNFELDISNAYLYSDDYEMKIDPASEMEFTDEYVVTPEYEVFIPELIATVIAKSVALEKVEVKMEGITDAVDGMIAKIEKGKMRLDYKNLVRTTARIARHSYNTIAYIMILDKPDVTWANSQAQNFYDRMANTFELNDRFEILQRKKDILNGIMDNFSSVTNSVRGLFVEWVIVALITFEIVLAVYEFIRDYIR